MQAQAQVQTEVPPAPANAQPWLPATRFTFQFVFLYFVLYNFPFPIGWIPGTEAIYESYSLAWHKMVPWLGSQILHLSQPIAVFTNGSGDTTYDYVLALIFLTLAFTGTVFWSLLDRKRQSYQGLHAWFILGLRLLLGGTMLLFGSVKIFPVQFREPLLSRLLEPYGDSSPMGLLWTFMGASRAYMMFTGILEMSGGALLIFQRTATLGALISAAALANVFMLNMSYDVPVKLYSFHLLLISLLLLAPELRRLGNLFLFNRTVEPRAYPPLSPRPRLTHAVLLFQLLFGGYIACNALYQAHKVAEIPKPPLYGVWTVEEFAVNGEVRPPLLTDGLRWQRLVFDEFDGVAIQTMHGDFQRYSAGLADDAKVLRLARADSAASAESVFAMEKRPPDLIVLAGQMDGRKIHATLRRSDPSFLLKNRGFHWINEYPFNK